MFDEQGEEQIVRILQEYAAGAKVSGLCRRHGMSDGAFYKWKAKYGGLQVSGVRRLKDLEGENSKLKKLLAEQSWSEPLMRHWFEHNGERWTERASGKKLLTPADRRKAVMVLCHEYRLSQRRACGWLEFPDRVTPINRCQTTMRGCGNIPNPERHYTRNSRRLKSGCSGKTRTGSNNLTIPFKASLVCRELFEELRMFVCFICKISPQGIGVCRPW
jgi:putative transposase